jgi:fused signal recognition particle receptor
MPEGIVPELLIGLALLLLIFAAVFLSRRASRPKAPPREPAEGVPIEETEAEDAVDEAERELAEELVTDQAAPGVAEAPPAAEAPPDIWFEEPVVEPVEVVKPPLRERLARSRRALSSRLAEAFGGGVDKDTWDDLEAALIQADVGVDIATRVVGEVRDEARQAKVSTPDDVKALLADHLVGAFDHSAKRGLGFNQGGVTVWLIVGVNGTGKTTTIGKLANHLRSNGRSVGLAAADTFRAAADEQLGIWADRADAQLVKHQPGADPGAVAFDAYQHARARGLDALVVDTAGRLHTKTPLMDELAKIRRVLQREGDVNETLLIIDATAGQNGLVQAKEFADATGITGVVLTKLDGTARGGIAVAIESELGIPIKLIGVGEGIDDLEPFEPKAYVEALLS